MLYVMNVMSNLCCLFRHEHQSHPDFQPAETASKSSDVNKDEDYLFNYHQAKMSFGLILMAFEDAVKEGDGQRLHELYRLMLLIYKSKGHHKYAYVTLLQLVKLSALYSEFEAHRAKWNRGVNTTGGKGKNIPLDLLKEQKNLSIKTLWRNLGPNLNEHNAMRLAGIVDPTDDILAGVDRDCNVSNKSASRSIASKEEAVKQIIEDLVSKQVFTYTRGREGHPSFPEFKSDLLSGLDYRDLHKWMTDLIETWASIYQP